MTCFVLAILIVVGAISTPGSQRPADAQPIEKLFAFIREASTSHPFRVDAQYDQARGYPIRVCVDPAENVLDDESGFVISDFSALWKAGVRERSNP